MHIIFLNGSEFRGKWRDLRRALWSPHFVGLVLGMTGIIFLVQPYNHIMPEGVIVRMLIVASCVLVFLATAIGLLAIGYRTCTRMRTFVVMLPAIGVSAVWGVELSVALGGQGLSPAQWMQLLAFDLVVAIIGEVVLSSFLLGRIAAQTGMKAHPVPAIYAPEDAVITQAIAAQSARTEPFQTPEQQAPVWIDLLGKQVQSDTVIYLKAEEHYVCVALHGSPPLLLRGRLADAMACLPEGSGMQVHRSYWVATPSVADLLRHRDGWRIVTHSGQEIPVARNRQTEVRAWVEQHAAPA